MRPEMYRNGVQSAQLILALLGLLSLLGTTPAQAQPPEGAVETGLAKIVLWNRNYGTAPVNQILALALRESRDLFGPFQLIKSQPLEQGPAFRALAGQEGHVRLDVASGATSRWREKHLLAIPLPVIKGLLGYRVCLTRKSRLADFRSLKTAFDWQSHGLKIGQAESWPDTRILRRNGFTVVGTQTYQALFKDVSSGKFACFLRSVDEVVPELNRHPDLTIEPSILFFYPEPAYFFVRSSDHRLAARIELGLLRAMDDGSYRKLFRRDFMEPIRQLHLGDRVLFHLNNPYLSPATRQLLKDDALWFRP